MKRSTKIVSAILSALTVSTAIASSAAALFISDGAKVVKNIPPKASAVEALKDEGDYIFYDGAWYRKVTSGREIRWYDTKGYPVEIGPTDNAYSTNPYKTTETKNDTGIYFGNGQVFKNTKPISANPLKDQKAPIVPGTHWGKGGVIRGGCYYTRDEAKKGVSDYFDVNSYDLRMFCGEKQAFGSGAKLFSTDPGVVYFDEKTGMLTAKNYGVAEVYVYTTGMIPFFRIDVSVVNPMTPEKKIDSLKVVPDDWQLSVGDMTCLSVSSVSGKVYDDIVFDIWHGKGALDAKNGKFTATDNGAVIVRAYSKSNRNIYGDALLYVGSAFSAVSVDGWKKCTDGISVSGWDCDFTNPWMIDGWIRGLDGIYIPVVRKFDVTYTDFDGSKKDSTAVTYGVVTYADLLREAYGSKESVSKVIDSYNLFKYGKDCGDAFSTIRVTDPNDYQILFFAKMLEAFQD